MTVDRAFELSEQRLRQRRERMAQLLEIERYVPTVRKRRSGPANDGLDLLRAVVRALRQKLDENGGRRTPKKPPQTARQLTLVRTKRQRIG